MAQKQNTGTEAPVVTMDAFSNPAARIGFGTLDLLQATEYPMTRMTQNYQLLTSLYRENWIIQNIIATIPNDMKPQEASRHDRIQFQRAAHIVVSFD